MYIAHQSLLYLHADGSWRVIQPRAIADVLNRFQAFRNGRSRTIAEVFLIKIPIARRDKRAPADR
jgi:hypothetical protein